MNLCSGANHPIGSPFAAPSPAMTVPNVVLPQRRPHRMTLRLAGRPSGQRARYAPAWSAWSVGRLTVGIGWETAGYLYILVIWIIFWLRPITIKSAKLASYNPIPLIDSKARALDVFSVQKNFG